MPNPPAAAETRIPVETLRRRARSELKGRQPSQAAREAVRALIGPGPHAPDQLIELLHRLNDAHGALFEGHLVALAAEMRLAMAEVVEVASFYHHFEILPDDAAAPALTVRVCDGLACAMAGAPGLMAALAGTLGAQVRVVHAPCVGRCEQAPVAVVGQRPLPQATAGAVQAAVTAGESTHPPAADDAAFDPVAKALGTVAEAVEGIAPPYVGLAAYRAAGGYQLAAELVNGERNADEVLAALDGAGLRGLGGAGFPAGRKWRIVRGYEAPRLMAVNIDEGEPGTFKDRTYLERDPHRFLEGVLVAAQVVGTEAVYLYLRDEYAGCRAILECELARLREDPPCPLPPIELRRGAGAYICGEESAMLESIEGRRGEPRLRPPYIAERGLFGRPTLEHNFETLYWVRDIVERGPAWFTSFGRHGRTGLRSFSVSGRVKQPGVKLAPAGITLRELVDEYCGGMAEGHTLYAYLPGGASGGILPASLANVPLDFDTLQPHGCFIGSAAVIVLSQHDRARDAALNAMRFFADESCGQCTPCRVGTEKAARLMQQGAWDHTTLDDLSAVMADASICGLGQAAPNAIRCVQRYFADEVK
ncbi:NADH-ubiquinone oxidoreductase-F iron-sulfur binding region domain-containing protein [Ideonella sp.]|uniref:NADH-ubiquinone oxidoreductase-F iron-sulfur binding region domain-containing protein n=1 Tax=Ideonella sp. TaxID=1929293 RepID=UPI002B4987CF|nr:NADH-ubiquinone oxidoreductase-F iron-sulfur binding region domain-containing protein [Ideonella sp.]HJV70712.1 NADH-ubiquinone oxidoreductase-F iron-sulfur binding region domain-containing protein [Ideonella sp.]